VTRGADEVPAFVRISDEGVFTMLHRPRGLPRGGFLFCHPLGEEKLWSHRVFVNFARRLAASGWTVLRMDFRGEGDSSRAFEDSDLHTRLEDSKAGLAALRTELPDGAPVGLLGLRFGAAVAAKVAGEAESRVERLVLWDPVVEGAPYMQTLLMANLAYQLAVHRRVVNDRRKLVEDMHNGKTVNIEGYEMSLALFEQGSAVDLNDTISQFHGQGLVVQIAPAGAPPKQEFVDLSNRCKGLVFAQAREEPFWKEIKTYYQQAQDLANLTHKWIEETSCQA
jgi:pimeloyl-ACP methyl ester carboxylesterase